MCSGLRNCKLVNVQLGSWNGIQDMTHCRGRAQLLRSREQISDSEGYL